MSENSGNGFSLTRRSLLKGTVATGLVGGLSPVAFSGAAQAAEPKKGGIIKVAVSSGNTTDSTDPGLWAEAFTMIGFSGAVYNNLVEINDKGELIPELAVSWEATPDAKNWTFKLRNGIEFHNGKVFGAEDVVATIRHHQGEDSKSAAKGLLTEVENVRADGNNVVFELKGGNADFPYVLTDFHLVMLPSKDGVADWKSGHGTGGYKIKHFEPGVRLELVRNDNYWKQGRAHFDGAEVLVIADDTARINALMTGEVDLINRVNLKAVHLLKRNPNVVIDNVTGRQHYTFPMMMDRVPYKNNDVRLAIKYAVDREALVKTALKGYGMVGNDHPISPAYKFYNKDLPQRPYDPDLAKFHLKKANEVGLQIKLHVSDAAFSGATNAAVMMKEHMSKAGIDLHVVRAPSDGFWNDVWMKESFCASYYFGRPTEDSMLSLVYAENASWNESHFKHDKFNQLLSAARSELDEEKRRSMYYEMQSILSNEGSTLMPMFGNFVSARTKKIANDGKLSSNAELDGLRVIERWWQA